jgi:hypothetical protein
MGTARNVQRWILTMIAVAMWGCCVVTCMAIGAAIALGDLSLLPALGLVREPPTPTSVPSATRTHSLATSVPIERSTRVVHVTPTLPPTDTRQSTPAPTQTHTPRPSSTPVNTPAPGLGATPTPVVCDDLDNIGQLTLVAGQQFACTISQEALTARLRQQPDLPCSEIGVALDDGEVRLTCQMGIRLNATGVVQVQDCRASVRIVRGTIGFTQVIQNLIDQNAGLVPDAICVEEATVAHGEIAISGHGR